MPINLLNYAPDWIQEFKRCEKWIEDALEYSHGTFTIESVFEDYINGHLQLWPGEKSVIVTQIVDYPGKKVLHMFLAGGDIEELEILHTSVEEYAKSVGCGALTLTGRPGWAKSFLRERDYIVKEIQMYKEL